MPRMEPETVAVSARARKKKKGKTSFKRSNGHKNEKELRNRAISGSVHRRRPAEEKADHLHAGCGNARTSERYLFEEATRILSVQAERGIRDL